jgi:iron complex outermembrane recepter protein
MINQNSVAGGLSAIILRPLMMVAVAATPMTALADLIEEVVVIAKKRQQNIQDVGASITAFTAEQIELLGFDEVGDVAAQSPNVNVSIPGGAGSNPSISIRGIGLSDFSDSNEGPVSMYIDDVYLGSLAAQTAKIFDVEHIEVLRGPQGTLYGRNTTGGLIHYVTKKPTEVLDGYVELTYGSWGRKKLEAAAGGPLSKVVRGRVSVFHDENDGTQRDRGTGVSGNVVDITAARAHLDIDIVDGLLMSINIHTGKVDNKAQLFKHRGLLDANGSPCSEAAVIDRRCVDVFGFRDPQNDPRSVLTAGVGQTPLSIDTDGGAIKLLWSRGHWDVLSITAYEEVDKLLMDTTSPGLAGDLSATALLLHPSFLADNSQVSEELRFSYRSNEINGLVGFYYFDDEKVGGIKITDTPSSSLPGVPAGGLTQRGTFDQTTKAVATFSHIDWSITQYWLLELGIRYSYEEKSLHNDIDPGNVFGSPPFIFVDEFDTENISWNVGLEWQQSENVLIFSNIARGFKSGGWNSGGLIADPVELTPFDEETVTAYELGVKNVFLDGRMFLNATVFYYDYDDFQAFTQSDNAGLPVSRLQNAGNATVKGGELEISINVANTIEAQLGLGYVDTQTKDFLSFGGVVAGEPIVVDLSGNELTLAPNFTANGLLRAHMPLLAGEVSAQLSVTYSDSYFFDSNNDPLQASGEFTLLNFRVTWVGGREDSIEIAAYINNLSNEDYIVEGFNLIGSNQLIYNERRLAGFVSRFKF